VRFLRHPRVQWALAVGLGAIFVYASLDKIAHPADFARIIYHYRILGPNESMGPLPANLLAVTLPWVELLAGLLLISGAWRREAAAVVSGLLVTFIAAVAWALFQGIDIENCGCFSVSGEGRGAGIKLLLGDLGMLVASLIVARLGPRASEESTPSLTTVRGPA